jgi:hypothetical protein
MIIVKNVMYLVMKASSAKGGDSDHKFKFKTVTIISAVLYSL